MTAARSLALLALPVIIALSCVWAFKDEQPRDLGSFWASGNAARHGEDPYGVYDETFRVDGTDATAEPNLNPPVSVPLFSALSTVPLKSAVVAWKLTSLTLFVLVVAILLATSGRREPLLAVWSISLAGFWHCLLLGQVYVALLALLVATWLLARSERPLRAALPLALLVAIKPNFVLWPLLIFVGGRQRSLSVAAMAGAIVLSLMPLLIYGTEIYRQWLDATPSLQEAGTEMARVGGNLALVAFFGRLGAWQVGFVLTGALILLAAWAVRRQPALTDQVAIVATLLAGPITWVGYTILLLPVFFTDVAASSLRSAKLFAAATLAFPFWLVIMLREDGVPYQLTEPLYAIGVIALLAALVVEARHAPATTRAAPQPEVGALVLGPDLR